MSVKEVCYILNDEDVRSFYIKLIRMYGFETEDTKKIKELLR